MTADSGMNRAFRVLRKPGEYGSLRTIIVALSLVAIVTQAGGLGLGRSVTASSLGQALKLVVPVRLDPGEQLSPECVTAHVQAGDAQLPAPLIHVVFDTGNDGTLRALQVTTVPSIEEPVVTVDLALGCPKQLTRQFVVFVDPPILARLAQVEPAATSQAPAGLDRTLRRQAAPAPTSAAENSAATPARKAVQPKPKRANRQAKAKPRASRAVSAMARQRSRADAIPDASVLNEVAKRGGKAPAKALAANKRRQAQAAAQRASESEGRLRLEAAASLVPTLPAPAASSVLMEGASAVVSLPASAAASGSVGLSKPLVQAVQAPPPEVFRQKPRTAARISDSKMPTLRTVWRAAQQGSPLALSFGLMSLALIAGVIYLWRLSGQEAHRREPARRKAGEFARHSQKPASWTEHESATIAPTASVVPRPAAVSPVAAATPILHGSDATSALMDTLHASRKPVPALHEQTQAFVSVGNWADYVSARFPTETPAPDSGLEPSPDAPATRQEDPLPVLNSGFSAVPAGPFRSAPVTTAATRAVSIEDLIDLEQQAEFCVALDQDSAAIELLQDHVRSTGGSSVLPYLKLLEIYKRLGDQPSYAAMRSAFIQRFGGAPPTWEGDLAGGAGLDAYTSVLDRIQQSWNDFGSSMALVQHLLVPTHDGEAGLYTVASSLSLPACLDLLLLFSVARDLSAHEVRGNEVDVYLPLDQAGSSAQAISMMATVPRPFLVRPGALVELDLDLDFSLGDTAPGMLSARSIP